MPIAKILALIFCVRFAAAAVFQRANSFCRLGSIGVGSPTKSPASGRDPIGGLALVGQNADEPSFSLNDGGDDDGSDKNGFAFLSDSELALEILGMFLKLRLDILSGS